MMLYLLFTSFSSRPSILCISERGARVVTVQIWVCPRVNMAGTMHSGNNINLCGQRTDLGDRTAIRTLVILQDHLADRLF